MIQVESNNLFSPQPFQQELVRTSIKDIILVQDALQILNLVIFDFFLFNLDFISVSLP